MVSLLFEGTSEEYGVLRAYERHLRSSGRRPLVIEIGCGYPESEQSDGARGMGGSMFMFADWLGSGTRVVGVDIIEGCKEYEDPEKGVFVEIGSQIDDKFMMGLVDKYGEPDIIIDDGSHIDEHMKTSFNMLFPCLKTDGVYAIEDCGGNHLRGDDQNQPKPFQSQDRFLQWSHQLTLQLNQGYAKNHLAPHKGVKQGEFPATSMGFMIQNISYYPNLVIIEKGANVISDQLPSPPHYLF